MAKNESLRRFGLYDDENTRFILEQLIQFGLEMVGASQGSLLLADPDMKHLRFAMVVSKPSLLNINKLFSSLVDKTVPIGEGVTGMAALTHDVQTATREESSHLFHVSGDGTPNAVLAAPMLVGERLLGVITAVRFTKRKSFTRQECEKYGILANIAAVVVHQQKLLGMFRQGKTDAKSGAMVSGERKLVDCALAFAHARPDKVDVLARLINDLKAF